MIRTCSGRDICQTNDQSSIKETYSLRMGEAWHFRPGHGFPWYFRVIRFTPWYFFVMSIARCMIFCCHELCIIILWRCMIFPCECWSALQAAHWSGRKCAAAAVTCASCRAWYTRQHICIQYCTAVRFVYITVLKYYFVQFNTAVIILYNAVLQHIFYTKQY